MDFVFELVLQVFILSKHMGACGKEATKGGKGSSGVHLFGCCFRLGGFSVVSGRFSLTRSRIRVVCCLTKLGQTWNSNCHLCIFHAFVMVVKYDKEL